MKTLVRIPFNFLPHGRWFLLALLFAALQSHAQDKKETLPFEMRDSLGLVREKGFISLGQRTGLWTFFDKDGKVTKKIKYRKDVAIWTFIYENDKITESINRKGKVKKRSCNCPN